MTPIGPRISAESKEPLDRDIQKNLFTEDPARAGKWSDLSSEFKEEKSQNPIHSIQEGLRASSQNCRAVFKRYQDEITSLREKITALSGSNVAKDHSIEDLNKVIQDKNSAIEKLQGKMALLIAMLKAKGVAARSMGAQAPLEAEESKALEVLQPKEPSLEAPSLKMVLKGDLQPLLGPLDPSLLKEVREELVKTLRDKPEESESIYNLAIYHANFDPSGFVQNRPLYQQFKEWLITRALENPTIDSEVEKRACILSSLAQNENAFFADLAQPLETIAQLKAFSLQHKHNLLQAVRGLNTHHLKKSEELFLSLAKEHLSHIQAPPLLGAEGKNLSLYDQLLHFPEFSVKITSPLKGKSGDQWIKDRQTRENIISDVLKSVLTFESLKKQLAKEASQDQEVSRTITPSSFSKETFLNELSDLADNPQTLTSDVKKELVREIEERISSRLKNLTGLHVESKDCIKALSLQIQKGEIPHTLKQALFQEDGREGCEIFQLLYYHSALSNTQEGFENFANHNQWNWLPSNSSLDKAKSLHILLKSLYKNKNFKGSPLTSQQVLWAQNIYALLKFGKINPIYAKTGSGKTSTVSFTIELLKTLSREFEQTTVHFLSPFAPLPTKTEGINYQQLTKTDGVIEIQVLNDEHLNDALLVDEAHLLAPHVKFILTSPSGKKREVEPLPITATPIISSNSYGEFKRELHQKIKQRHRELLNKIANKKLELAKEHKSVIARNKEKLSQEIERSQEKILTTYTEMLPRGRQGSFKAHFQHMEIENLLKNVSWILFPSIMLQNPNFTPAHLVSFSSIEQKPVPDNAIIPKSSLQKLPSKEFKEKASVLVNFANNLIKYRSLLRGLESSLELPPEIEKLTADLLSFEKQAKEMSDKIARWDSKESLASIDSKADFLTSLTQKKEATFKKFIAEEDHYLSRKQELFSPESASSALEEAFKIQKPSRLSQVIFPSSRFTEKEFPGLINALKKTFSQELGHPLYFVYQDSHSSDESQRGSKWAINANTNERIPLDLFLAQNLPKTASTVMLYDTSNKQGGDFNALSWSLHKSHNQEISQYLFYHLSDHDQLSKEQATSENDLFQALSRRRGDSSIPPVVTASNDANYTFLESVRKTQHTLEKEWAARNAANMVSKKILKSYALIKAPLTIVKAKPLSVLQKELGFEGINIVQEVQKSILNLPKEGKGTEDFVWLNLAKDSSEKFQELIENSLGIEKGMEKEEREATWKIEVLIAKINHLIEQAAFYD